MSKLDRQLDEVHGQEKVIVNWNEDDDIEIEVVRDFLISQIDARKDRIPLDLRGVEGAPRDLVKVIRECQKYARERGKVLSISSALLPMQEALLSGGRRVRKKEVAKEETGAAGRSAQSILSQNLSREDPSHYDLSKAEKISRKKSKKRSKSQSLVKRYAVLAAVIVAITGTIGVVEYIMIFGSEEPPVNIPEKTFE